MPGSHDGDVRRPGQLRRELHRGVRAVRGVRLDERAAGVADARRRRAEQDVAMGMEDTNVDSTEQPSAVARDLRAFAQAERMHVAENLERTVRSGQSVELKQWIPVGIAAMSNDSAVAKTKGPFGVINFHPRRCPRKRKVQAQASHVVV